MWQLTETLHAVVYFAPEKRNIYAEAGLKGGWMGYFASRAAAMGPVGAGVVTATFYNFAPGMVARAIPDAWRFSTVEDVLAARFEVVDRALQRLLADEIDGKDLTAAAELGLRATLSLNTSGRPLYAAHAGLEVPRVPHLILWHATTLLREHRGDGHVALLTAEGIDGCEANVLMAAEGLVSEREQPSFRGWSAEEWSAAKARLRERKLIDGSGLTPRGEETRARIEAGTDELATQVVDNLGEDYERFTSTMSRIQKLIVARGEIPFPNPIGLPPPVQIAADTAPVG
jgi:hypothetical protein